MKNHFKLILCLWFMSTGVSFAANVTSITNVTIIPSNPSPGQVVTVTWTYNISNVSNNPHALIVISNSDTLQAAGTANQYIVLGDGCAPTTQVTGGCAVGTNVPMGTNAISENVTIPATLTPGFTYYVIVGMKDYNVYMNPSVSVDQQNYVSFTIPLPPPYINLTKVADGSTANLGGEVLFNISYNAANTHNFTITDAIPPQFSISQVFQGGVQSGQNITWSLGNISSPVTGYVSVLTTLNTGTAGQVFSNTAYGQSTEITSTGSTALVTVSEPGLTVFKSAPASVATGAPITYVINYTNTGLELSEFQNFANGIPPGWISTGGTWDTVPGYLEQTESCAALSTYPYLTDSTMAPILNGVYQVDMMISPQDCNNFDAVLNFNVSNSTGTTPVTAFQAHISGQKGGNNASSDALAYDIGGVNVTYASPPNMGNIQEGAWYTVKVQVCSGQVLMKMWPQGTLEPGAWDINYTGANVPTTAGWVGFQANRGPVAFANLVVYTVVGATNPVVSDNVPSNVTYQGIGNGGTNTAGVLNWSVGTTCGASSAVSWWGLAGACGNPITNAAVISSSSGPAPVTSNSVTTLISGCTTNTFTPTSTNTATATPTNTTTKTATNTPTVTNTPLIISTFINTPTNTATNTPTLTPTSTATIVLSGTPTNTPISTWTPTPTVVAEVFQVCKNVFNITKDGTVCIEIGTNEYPGIMALRIYNSAGEHIKTLLNETLTQPLSITTVNWDGKNKFGQEVVSGVYVVYLEKPLGRALGRLVVIH